MIVSFSVSNFKSFSSEETISLAASQRLSGSHEDHLLPIPDSRESVLRTAVLYGANGAGKSNLFQALKYVKSVALNSRTKNSGTGRTSFRFARQEDETSSFDLQFIAEDKLYRFGFKANDERITEEWLFQVVGGRQRTFYERRTDQDGKVTIDADGLRNSGAKLKALATVGGPQNQSFLATVNATLESEDVGDDLGRVLTWFGDALQLIGPTTPFTGLGYKLNQDPDFLAFANEFLKASSTGVDRLRVIKKEVSKEDISRIMPNGFPSTILDLPAGKDAAIIALDDDAELMVERSDENRLYQMSIQAGHEHEPGNVVELQLSDESDGTRRLVNLMPALHRLRTSGAVYFIDEIDRSLHPILVREFLEFFLKSCEGSRRQIIVTTHESNLLDQDLLRRDEIWFAEKDQSGSTRLYSLSDFKVRNDLEIRKHYLQGRFGAVPFLGSLDRLLTKTNPLG